MKFTTRLELHSQATRLLERVSVRGELQAKNGTVTLSGALFQATSAWVTR